MNMINKDFAENQDSIKKIIKSKAENAKNTDKDSNHKKVPMYPATSSQTMLGGSALPEGFQHYSHCSCYKPNP